jgi:cyclase
MSARLLALSVGLSLTLGLVATTFSRTVDSATAVRAVEQRFSNSAPQAQGRGQQAPGAGAEELHVLPLQGFDHTRTYMIVGDGGNVVVQVGDDGALVVDTGLAAMSDKLLAVVRSVNTSGKPIQYVINTHFHADHTGGNGAFAKAGRHLGDGGTTAPIVAHENVLKRMTAPTGSVSPRGVDDWPTDTYYREDKDLFFNGEAIQVIFQRAAHTDGDSIVYFRKSDVLVAGDIFVTETYPIIDLQAGGHINGIIDGLNRMLDIAIPVAKQEDGTLIVPGHGRLCDDADLAAYRDMVVIVRDRVQDAVKRGLTLDQVKAAKEITLDFEGRYGAKTGFWTTDKFLEAVYANLTGKK